MLCVTSCFAKLYKKILVIYKEFIDFFFLRFYTFLFLFFHRSTIRIEVAFFNDTPGIYNDNLICSIPGLDQSPIYIPMKARVTGSCLSIASNTPGLDLSNKRPKLSWPHVIYSGPQMRKVNIFKTFLGCFVLFIRFSFHIFLLHSPLFCSPFHSD